MKLVKIRDRGMTSYTYYWTRDGSIVSPYFDSESAAQQWMTQQVAGLFRNQLTTK